MQNVLIVEDDNLQAGMLSATISQKYPDWTITHTDNLELEPSEIRYLSNLDHNSYRQS